MTIEQKPKESDPLGLSDEQMGDLLVQDTLIRAAGAELAMKPVRVEEFCRFFAQVTAIQMVSDNFERQKRETQIRE